MLLSLIYFCISGLIRLEELYFEETIIACTLTGDKHVMVEFPTDSEIQFIVAKNSETIMDSILVKQAVNHCDKHIDEYVNSIKVVQNFYPEHVPIKSDIGIKDRSLPPLPDTKDTVSVETMSSTDDFTDDESECNSGFHGNTDVNHNTKTVAISTDTERTLSGQNERHIEESHYEMIPGDFPSMEHGINGIGATHTSYTQNEDEEGYLMPVKPYANGHDSPVLPHIYRTSTKELVQNSATADSDVVINTEVQLPTDDSTGNVNERLEQHLRERLDAFLIDSVQEFNRMRVNDTENDNTDPTIDEIVHKEPQPSLETQDDLNKYLENLFDCDKMEQAAPSPRQRMKRLNSVPGTFESALVNVKVESKRHSSIGDDIHNDFMLRHFETIKPDATIRRHNFKTVIRPVARSLVFNDDSACQMPVKFDIESQMSSRTLPMETRNSAFRPIDKPSNENSSGAPVYDSPPPMDQGSDHRTNRTDSGIFVSPKWQDPYSLDYDSPYKSSSESSWAPPDDLSRLSVQEVAHCLRYIGMRDYVVMYFTEEQIDGKQLLELDQHLLSEGFPQLNALERKKIVDFAQGWRPKK